jgi:hypothetical protein
MEIIDESSSLQVQNISNPQEVDMKDVINVLFPPQQDNNSSGNLSSQTLGK